MSTAWHTGALFSLWFPAAGLRFAFLWRFGARFAPGAALAEALVQLASGMNSLGPNPLLSILGILGPCLAYGGVIYLTRSRISGRAPVLGAKPLPFALAAMIGPLVACLTALLWAVPRVLEHGTIDTATVLKSMLVFALGDMLGILLVAPPLLWMVDRLRGQEPWAIQLPRRAVAIEVGLVMIAAWVLVWALRAAGLGLMLAPVLLATCWTGLRTGRGGAWIAILLAASVYLPLTGQETSEVERLRVHMLLACVAAIGFLAASFAEAEAHSRREIARRDRLLYHADRLKTLRGMSVALIHEISQPLSTIALEARNLDGLVAQHTRNGEEIGEAARLIARKSDDLAELVRRLRGFGDRRAGSPAPIPLRPLFLDLQAIALPEAKARKVLLHFDCNTDAFILGQELEVRQAMLNLIRNAIAASPPGSAVAVSGAVKRSRIILAVENACSAAAEERAGMGIGLIIARSIAEAHSGTIRNDKPSPYRVRYLMDLPLHEEADD